MRMRKLWTLMGMILLISCLTGCAWQEQLSAEESFNRALSGLSGIDNFSFQGEAAIRSEENGPFQQSMAFEGHLQHHKDLTLSSKGEAAKLLQEKGPADSIYKADGLKVTLKRRQGRWSTLSSQGADEMWMTRLNPLELLEYLGNSEKTVTQELGAARGTKVLRIELSPEAAAEMAYGSLDEQMKVLAERIERKGDPLYSDNPKVRKQLKTVWERDYKEMRNRLQKADALSVSHLTINRKNHLPAKLTMERKLSFIDSHGKTRTETLLSEVTFTGY
ncbi:hypothetical protein [Paenibacillus sp. Cedars]|uniref:hypothetical protein n=1 Tax=Paenibacillus sp. Cedars TaxID=1980674 RepID=UPI00116448AC|nr:hypothetical protein [Paenibacillus sp. Cedars]AWP28663.1 hypothetical protein B9D94_19425 [Paenibacillus sp. Cedars]